MKPSLHKLLLFAALVPFFALAGMEGAFAQESFHIGLDFLETTKEILTLPQTKTVDGELLVDANYYPFTITDPSNNAVMQGGVAGWSESDVLESVRFKVEQTFRLAALDELGDEFGRTFAINIYNGAVPTSVEGRRLNVVVGSNNLSTFFGWSQGNAALNTSLYPDDSYAAAVFADNLDAIGADPTVMFNQSSDVINNLAGTIAHEIGHLFGLDHQVAGSAPYSVMAVGGTGLQNSMRLTERRFNDASEMDLLAVLPTVMRGDFNMDGDVDIFQVGGLGDAQVLSENIGTTINASFSQGDANGDGDVDVFEFGGFGDASIFSQNLGSVQELPAGITATYHEAEIFAALDFGQGQAKISVLPDLHRAPEPGTFIQFCLGMITFIFAQGRSTFIR